MPSWLGEEIVVRHNTSEADKVIRSGHTLDSPATQRQPTLNTVPINTTQPPTRQPTQLSTNPPTWPETQHTHIATTTTMGASDPITVHLTDLQSAIASLTTLVR